MTTIYIAGGDGRGDDMEFIAGEEYIFVVDADYCGRYESDEEHYSAQKSEYVHRLAPETAEKPQRYQV